MQVINQNGINCDVRLFAYDESTTIHLICMEYEIGYAQVVKMKDGLIRGIVTPSTKVIELIDDGYSYRLDLYNGSISGPNNDQINICVKFIGDSPAERKKTPLLVKIPNGNALYTIGYHLARLFNFNVRDVPNFEYSIDGKCVKKDYVPVKPKDPEVVLVVSLDTKQIQRSNPTYSYKVLLNK